MTVVLKVINDLYHVTCSPFLQIHNPTVFDSLVLSDKCNVSTGNRMHERDLFSDQDQEKVK